MKKLLSISLFVFIFSSLFAQTPLCPVKQGAVLIYYQKNAKGVIQSQQRTTVKRVSGTPEKMTIEYDVEILDENGKSDTPPAVSHNSVVSHNGVIDVDIAKMLANAKGMEKAKIEVSGEGFKLTPQIKIGQRANNTNINISLGIIKIKATVSNTQCTAIEDVNVGAGTFRAFRIEQTITATALGIKNVTRTVTWYAEGVGTVKAVNYDNKGKLLGTKELMEMR
jgi:hypothetical protein